MSDRRRALYALPPREGGLGIADPTEDAMTHFANSRKLTTILRQKLADGDTVYDLDPAEISRIKTAAKNARREAAKEAADELAKNTSHSEKKLMEYNRRKGAGAIFTTIPLERYGFDIKCKEDYRDILRLRYRLRIPNLPRECVCGKDYTLDHSQMCKTGGFIHMRHDEPKSIFAALCSQVHNDVEVEPKLIPLSGEQLRMKSANKEDDARSDVSVRDFYRRQQSAFFEFRVSHPFARSYFNQSPEAFFKSQSATRRREYLQRINDVDCGSFVPMIMSSTGAMGPEMSMAVKTLVGD
jgi:hypothetical protein